jgi:hypothetical protein
MVLSLSLLAADRLPKGIHLGFLACPVLLVVLEPTSIIIICSTFIAIGGTVIFLIRDDEKRLGKARYPLGALSAAAALLVPSWVPLWMIIAVVIISLGALIRYRFIKGHSDPIWGIIMVPLIGTVLVWLRTADPVDTMLAASILIMVISGALSFGAMVLRWEKVIDPRASLLMVLLVISYIAFYVYYGWTEVYMTEFMVTASIVGGLLVHVMASEIEVRGKAGIPPLVGQLMRRRRIVPKMGPIWKVSMMALLVISTPCSIASFLDDNWFTEESMDKRPYMRTIERISTWIDENTDESESIVAWHCYAVQSDRETLLDVTNAARYDGGAIARQMEEKGVRVFILCYYTDHGLWYDQPEFQHYILSNFRVDLVVDGNMCFIRT